MVGSGPEAPYYLHDISVGLAGADSPPEPLSRQGEGQGRRLGFGAAAVQTLSGFFSEPWIPAGVRTPQGLERPWPGPHLCLSFPGSPGKLLQERNANNLLV